MEDFSKKEKETIKFWKENEIFEKSSRKKARAQSFVFYEGPPTANAAPGLHHALARVFKDIIPRYKTMRGFNVARKAGWDTHGLPVELQIEKKLGLKNKKDIETYGIAKFNEECRKSVWEYKAIFEEMTERIGYWVDMKHPYITYENNYIESLWWIIKEIYSKGLLFQRKKVVPYCPRCGTTLSSHEVAQGYKKVKEPAIFVKFRIKNPEFNSSFLLVWTTTPWTIPGNVAIAVNPNFSYAKVKTGDNEYLILSENRIEACGVKGEVIEKIKGKDLVGLRYEAPYPPEESISAEAFRVVPADFVSLEDGTGLVHIAPAFGEDDMESGLKNNLPALLNVNREGEFNLNVKKWAGLFVKDADPLIIEDLEKQGILFKKELYEHEYPFCWRCKSPLLYYAKESWFIEATKVKEKMMESNQRINWFPSHLRNGRFGEWLKEVKDWALSRERYWGTPLPVWKCKSCNNLMVVGSKEDLLNQGKANNNYFIIRHGEALGNVNKIASNWPEKFENPLTEKGREQVLKAVKKLKNKKIDLIFCSDILRTMQTAEIISKELGVKIKTEKSLREIDNGILNGEKIENVGRFWDPEKKLAPMDYYLTRFDKAVPKGENYFEVMKRMYGFMEKIEAKYKGKNILMVGHQAPFSLLEGVLNCFAPGQIVKNIFLGKKEIKIGEVREMAFKDIPLNRNGEVDFHRPFIDEIKLHCERCGGEAERFPDVLDCWFDSGAMPYAQHHYPFENKGLIDSQFPADYISEAIDQTRGWFYTLHVLSNILRGDLAYKNVVCLGHILDEKGEKMSKSKGNIVLPDEIIEKYGADAIRWWFFTVNQPGGSKVFSEKDIAGCLRKFIMTFWNCYVFYNTYAKKSVSGNQRLNQRKSVDILDKWILSRLNGLILETTTLLDNYDITKAARTIEDFIVNDLSLWYIRRSRKKFQKPKTEKDLETASKFLGYILLVLSKITAPFIPFLSEEIYQEISGLKFPAFAKASAGKQISESVHLEDWPKADKKKIDKELEKNMAEIRGTIVLALAERAKAGIKVRQPLRKLKIQSSKFKIDKKMAKELLELLKDEINVKEIVFDAELKQAIELDTEITPELKEEGTIREIIRNIQDMRKEAGLKSVDIVSVEFLAKSELGKLLEKNKEAVLRDAKIKGLEERKTAKAGLILEKEIMIDGEVLWLALKQQ